MPRGQIPRSPRAVSPVPIWAIALLLLGGGPRSAALHAAGPGLTRAAARVSLEAATGPIATSSRRSVVRATVTGSSVIPGSRLPSFRARGRWLASGS